VNRADGATYLGQRLGAYLSAVNRTAADSSGNVQSVIDDALRALGYAAADIATAAPAGEEGEEDFRVQLIYRAMVQIVRDLGTVFNLSTSGDSFSLNQMRTAAEKDLHLAAAAVLERFGTLGVVASDDDTPFVTIDLNFLDDVLVVV
jgi:hypothetical protein